MGKQKITTIVNFILDTSGSMSSIQDTVISGFNEYIHGLKKAKTPIKFSLTLFDSNHLGNLNIDKRYVAEDIKNVKPLNTETYSPGGGTPLYDAAVTTIEAIAKKVDHAHDGEQNAIVTIIMTDGEENSSKEFDEECLKDLIQKLEKKGNWTFAFMGANIDAYATAKKFGIAQGNTVSWESTRGGTVQAMAMMADSTMDFSVDNSKGILRSASFFAKDKGGDFKNDTQS